MLRSHSARLANGPSTTFSPSSRAYQPGFGDVVVADVLSADVGGEEIALQRRHGQTLSRPILEVRRARRHLPFHQRLDLADRVEGLALAGGRRQAPDMGRRDNVRQPREFRRRHLVGRAADIHGGAGDTVFRQDLQQRRLVDQIAARHVDEEGVRLHAGEGRRVQQVLGLLVGDGEADHVVGAAQQLLHRQLLEAPVVDLGVGIGHQHRHAHRRQHRRQLARDAAVADDADRAAGKLPADLDLGLAALVIGRRRARDAAREIDQEADGQLDHRLHEARLGMGHQHARLRGRRHVDVADVDGAAHHDLELRQAREDLGRHRRRAVGDDEVDVLRRGDHALADRAARRPRAASTSTSSCSRASARAP